MRLPRSSKWLRSTYNPSAQFSIIKELGNSAVTSQNLKELNSMVMVMVHIEPQDTTQPRSYMGIRQSEVDLALNGGMGVCHPPPTRSAAKGIQPQQDEPNRESSSV